MPTKPSTPLLLGLLTIFIVGGVIGGFMALTHQAEPDLDARLEQARTVLEQARRTGSIANDPRYTALALPDLERIDARKMLFIAKILPQIAAENQRIRSQRWRIKNTPSLAQLNALAIAYRLKPGNVSRNELLKRVDTVPESLVLGQAALESAWGTSRFARQGHAYFGERTFDPDAPGMVPKRASGFKVKSFTEPYLSVRSYMRTLNTHRAYKALRERRAVLHNLGRTPSGEDLAYHLGAYSEIGQSYVTRILATIKANRLSDFDDIQSHNASP
ncbi:MAG: glucosaminidase domain-containing protein [Magnetovibrio sp.]|nr:glucosaminidase domain-containing protein [Magnetovibrio sp.]